MLVVSLLASNYLIDFIFFFPRVTDVPKEVSENSREFPEQSSQILKKSEYIIYQHI